MLRRKGTRIAFEQLISRGIGDTTMDESFFPILWREDGYRSAWVDEYVRAAVPA